MRIARIEIKADVSDKNEWKHSVRNEEVYEVFRNYPKIAFIEKGHIAEEDVYRALGETDSGRYLAVLFIYKKDHTAFTLSARDMTLREKKRYGKK